MAVVFALGVVGCNPFSSNRTPVGERSELTVEIVDVSPRLGNTRTPASEELPSGRAIALAVSSDGRRAYAGALQSGLWRSDDGGLNWYQPWLPQPGDGPRACPAGSPDPCRLGSRTVVAIAVSPSDPDLVFVGTANDRGRPERDGIYRSADGGRTWTLVHQQTCPGGTGVEGVQFQPIGQIEFAPDGQTKLWAAVGCGVAYSTVSGDDPADLASRPSGDEVGRRWTSVTGSPGTGLFHVGVAEATVAGRVVWACGTRVTVNAQGRASPTLWYSTDGGRTYLSDRGALARQVRCDQPTGMHQGSMANVGAVTSTDAFAVDPRTGTAYFVGYPMPATTGWVVDCRGARQSNGACPAQDGRSLETARPCTPATACDMGIVEATYDPARQGFAVTSRSRPPQIVDVPAASGDVTLVGHLTPDRQRFLLLMSDTATVHVAEAPVAGADSWHRLDGPLMSEACEISGPTNRLYACDSLLPHRRDVPIHVDPHAIAVSRDVNLSFLFADQSGVHQHYRDCASRDTTASIVMSNDGGIVRSTNCGNEWVQGEGFNTLVAGELAGLSRQGGAPALYFGGRDNSSWWSDDGGAHWRRAVQCGDCSGFFTDDPARFVGHTVRASARFAAPNVWQLQFRVWTAAGGFPDPAGSSFTDRMWQRLPYADSTVLWEPLIRTRPGEQPVPGGDLVAVAGSSATATDDASAGPPYFVQRNRDGTGWQQVGPALPARSYPVLQTAGGHARPAFFVGNRVPLVYDYWDAASQPLERLPNGQKLWRSRSDASGTVVGWDCVVPGPDPAGVAQDGCDPNPLASGSCPPMRACRAWAFAVNPYDEGVVYVVDDGGVKVSVDGGGSWTAQPELTAWLTDQGRITSPSCRWTCGFSDGDQLLTHLVFVPGEPATRFAAGNNGVFLTLSGAVPGRPGGERWHRLLDPMSLACQPTKLFFDARGNPTRSLYVGCVQRGVLRLEGVPRPDQAAAVDARRLRVDARAASLRPAEGPGRQRRFDGSKLPEAEELTKDDAARVVVEALPTFSPVVAVDLRTVTAEPPSPLPDLPPVTATTQAPPGPTSPGPTSPASTGSTGPGGTEVTTPPSTEPTTSPTTGVTSPPTSPTTPGTTPTTRPPPVITLAVAPLLVEQGCKTSGGVLPAFDLVLDAAGATGDVGWSASPYETLSDGSTPWAVVKPAAGVVLAGGKVTITVVPAEQVCADVAKAGKVDFHVYVVWAGGEAIVTDVVTNS